MSFFDPKPDPGIDISDLTAEICKRLGVDWTYVKSIEIDAAGEARFICYAGKDGFCKGKKYVHLEPDSPWHGEAAMEPMVRRRVVA